MSGRRSSSGPGGSRRQSNASSTDARRSSTDADGAPWGIDDLPTLQSAATAVGLTPERLAWRFLPMTAVIITFVALYIEYVFLHCYRLLQYDVPESLRIAADVDRATSELWTFHIFTGLLLFCFIRCSRTHPGKIPDSDDWTFSQEEALARNSMQLVEKKQTGARRECKWCYKYKPDRAHHCRVCEKCVLRMDHHCPWVDNCIGFRNHKFFFLLIVYSVVVLWLVSLRMFDSVWWSTRIDVSIITMTFLITGQTFASFLTVLMTSFLGFHVWLMLKAMTTVEFCEKSLKEEGYDSSIYVRSPHMNVCAVLGPRPLFWLFPFSLPIGDGVDWAIDPSAGTQRRTEKRATATRKLRSAARTAGMAGVMQAHHHDEAHVDGTSAVSSGGRTSATSAAPNFQGGKSAEAPSSV